MGADLENEKRLAAVAAADLVEDGMTIGLGTGSTVAYLLAALSSKALDVLYVATSPATEHRALELGLRIEPFESRTIDMAIDGADQISPQGWLVKGGGSAHTREKVVAATARRFVVIADSTKPVASLHPPVPLELLAFGLESTLARLGTVAVRDVPPSPDGGVIADFTGEVGDPAELADRLGRTPGVVEHGLFPPSMVTTIFVGRGGSVDRLDVRSH